MEIIFVVVFFAFCAFCVAGLVNQNSQQKGGVKNSLPHDIDGNRRVYNVNGQPMIGGYAGVDSMGNSYGSTRRH
jgi:hypothetical protein